MIHRQSSPHGGVLFTCALMVIALFTAGAAVAQAEETSTIHGIIVDTDNEPIPGVTVTTDPTTQTACSGDDGRYTLTVFEAVPFYRITARRAGYLERRTGATQTPSGRVNVDIILEPSSEGPIVPACSPTALGEPPDLEQYASGALIGGLIVDGEGQPVAGATVTTEPAAEAVSSSDSGNYTIAAGLQSGVRYDVRATAEGYLPGEASVVAVANDTTSADMVMLRDDGRAEGRGWGDEGAGLGGGEPTDDSAEGGTSREEEDASDGEEEDQGFRVTEVEPSSDSVSGQGTKIVFEVPIHIAHVPPEAKGGNDDVRVVCTVDSANNGNRLGESETRLPITKSDMEATLEVSVNVSDPGDGFAYQCRIVDPDCHEPVEGLDWEVCKPVAQGNYEFDG